MKRSRTLKQTVITHHPPEDWALEPPPLEHGMLRKVNLSVNVIGDTDMCEVVLEVVDEEAPCPSRL